MNAYFCDEPQLSRLLQLISAVESALSASRLKRLRIVSQLCRGISGVKIASVESVSAARVSKIKGDLRKTGIAAEIRKLEAMLEPQPTNSHQRGRPPFQRWEDMARSKGYKIDEEPFVEFAALILTPRAKVAVLAVNNPHRHLSRAIKAICSAASSDKCNWTYLSGFDRIISDTLDDLSQGSRILEAQGGSGEIPEISPLKSRFLREDEFCVIQEGDLDACSELLKFLFTDGQQFKSIQTEEKFGFFEQLGNICYRLRERWSCIGLFPCVWELYDDVARWEKDLSLDCFVWESGREMIQKMMKLARVTQEYFAVNGVLFSLTPSLWGEVPFRDESNFRTLTTRPKIEVLHWDSERFEVELMFNPVPEFGYTRTIRWRGAPEELVKAYRKAGPVRFSYSTRPESKNEGGTSQEPKVLMPEELPRLKNIKRVVLMPRHILSNIPPLPLIEISRLSTQVKSGIDRFPNDSDDPKNQFLVVRIPRLLEEIRTIFRSNYYGDLHREMYNSQADICRHNFETRRGSRSVLMSGIMHQIDPLAGPYYFFEASDFANLERSPQVLNRLLHHQEVIKQRNSGEMEPGMNPSFPSKPGEYNEAAAFLALLTDFDADFLLMGLRPEFRAELDEIATEWADLVKNAVLDKYWNGKSGRPDRTRIQWLVPESLRSAFNDAEHPSRVHDAVASAVVDALRTFCEGKKRVIRTAIETAQRLALAGFEPATIVVEDEKSMFKAWRSFAKVKIRGALADVADRGRSEVAVEDVDAVDQVNPKKETLSGNRSQGSNFRVGSGSQDMPFDVGDIRSVSEQALAGDRSDSLLLEFYELCTNGDDDDWDLVLSEFGDILNPSEELERLLKAIELCTRRKESARRERSQTDFLNDLRRILKKS